MPRICPEASISVTVIEACRSGYHLITSFFTKSYSSDANSIDVGPPPTITNVRSRLASSFEHAGLLARSKLSIRLLRMARECSSYVKKKTFGFK